MKVVYRNIDRQKSDAEIFWETVLEPKWRQRSKSKLIKDYTKKKKQSKNA